VRRDGCAKDARGVARESELVRGSNSPEPADLGFEPCHPYMLDAGVCRGHNHGRI
jgi:hypothetical protein